MAKFTRTAYAGGSLRDLAHRIAGQAQLTDSDLLTVLYDKLSGHKKAGHKRVRITILVEPEAPPPKAPRKPRRPRPVQQALPLEAPPFGPPQTELARRLQGMGVDTALDVRIVGAH